VRGSVLVALAAAGTAGVGAMGAGCRADEAPPSGRDRSNLIYARPTDARLLDPARIEDNESVEVVDDIFDRLIHWMPGTGAVAPGLATTWELDRGGRVWTFRLRAGVAFHDGTPVDADAVVFSLERQRDPQHPFHRDDFLQWQRGYRNIEKVEAIDPLTVRITIDKPYAPFEANLAMFTAAIVSPTAVRRWGDAFGDHPVGSGPFAFERWDKGERIVLRRNPSYWGGPPSFERLIYEVIPDPRQRLIALESGAIDMASAILPDELQYVELHPQLVLHRAPSNNVTYLAMNTARPPFADVRVRRAVNHAINKTPIVQMGYQGLAVPADGVLPPDQWGHHQAPIAYSYDPVRAKALLAEAVAAGVLPPPSSPAAPVYKLYALSTPRPYLTDPERVARAVAANLADVGLSIELVLQPYADHLTSVGRGDHDLALFGWVGDNGDPDNFLYTLLDESNTHGPNASNIAFYRDRNVHELLVEAQQAPSRASREELYAAVQDRIAADAPWAPLAHSQVVFAARRDLEHVVLTPTGHVVFAQVRRR
jgi:peptide/nickel transport system substrate-binding protein